MMIYKMPWLFVCVCNSAVLHEKRRRGAKRKKNELFWYYNLEMLKLKMLVWKKKILMKRSCVFVQLWVLVAKFGPSVGLNNYWLAFKLLTISMDQINEKLNNEDFKKLQWGNRWNPFFCLFFNIFENFLQGINIKKELNWRVHCWG